MVPAALAVTPAATVNAAREMNVETWPVDTSTRRTPFPLSATKRYVSLTMQSPARPAKEACTPYALLALPLAPVPAIVVTVPSTAIFLRPKLDPAVDDQCARQNPCPTYSMPVLAMATAVGDEKRAEVAGPSMNPANVGLPAMRLVVAVATTIFRTTCVSQSVT
jgi:hypothetical protein